MSSAEFAEWLAYYRLEPFGEERADARSALLAALIANLYRNPKRRREPYQISDFMPHFEAHEADEKPAWQRIMEKMNIVRQHQRGSWKERR